MNRILVAEDEHGIASFIAKGLKANGYVPTVVGDGHAALAGAQSGDFDLLVLDLGLPGRDGLSVLAALRDRGVDLPVIILTARDGVDTLVTGLAAGADDFIAKPFRFDELLARIRTRLRAGPLREDPTLRCGDLALDVRTRQAEVGGRPVELSAREFVMAEAFLRHPGQVLSRQQLLSRVWGYDFDTESNVVDVYVGYLRKKFGAERIQTVRGMGYRLVDPLAA